MSKIIGVLLMVASLDVSWNGITEFDHASSAVPFIRGLFWLLVGAYMFSVGWDKFKKSPNV